MLIRQRSTFADDFLLQVCFPYLQTANARRLLAFTHLWSREIRLRSPHHAPWLAALVRDVWRRVISLLWAWAARASAQ